MANLRTFREVHIISDLGLRQSQGYRDAIEVLREEGILDDALADSMKGWMGLRNVLVHLYLKIDHGKTYQTIETELEDLERFAQVAARFLVDGG